MNFSFGLNSVFDFLRIKERRKKISAKHLLEMNIFLLSFSLYYDKYWNCTNTIVKLMSLCNQLDIFNTLTLQQKRGIL
jgi:hypothetical protein